MKGHPWTPGVDPGAETGSGLETLQTDVMRFLAILALCLMVIFALVQSLPEEPGRSSPQLQNRELLSADVEALQQRVEALRAESRELQRAIAAARRGLADSERDAAARRAELVALEGEVEALKRGFEQENEKLESVKAEVQSTERSLAVLRLEMEALRTEIGQAQERLAEKQRALDRLIPTNEPVAAPVAKPPAAAAKGLELRFESERVLRELIRAGTVGFYARAAGKYWRLTANETDPAFIASPSPGILYEMTPTTVPSAFVEALRRRVALFDRTRIVWGVTLPESTRLAITAGSRRHGSGALVIEADAGIRHHAR